MGAVGVRGILCAPTIPAMIQTLLTENDLEWKVFKYEFEQVDDAQSTLEEILTDVSEHAEDGKTMYGDFVT